MSGHDALLRDKRVLEHRILSGECGEDALAPYLDVLGQIDLRFTGILDFRWPSVPYPLYFRCGTTDLGNFR